MVNPGIGDLTITQSNAFLFESVHSTQLLITRALTYPVKFANDINRLNRLLAACPVSSPSASSKRTAKPICRAVQTAYVRYLYNFEPDSNLDRILLLEQQQTDDDKDAINALAYYQKNYVDNSTHKVQDIRVKAFFDEHFMRVPPKQQTELKKFPI